MAKSNGNSKVNLGSGALILASKAVKEIRDHFDSVDEYNKSKGVEKKKLGGAVGRSTKVRGI